MPNVVVSIDLPYLLLLPAGEYPTPGEGGSVRLEETSAPVVGGGAEAKTVASTTFVAHDETDAITLTRMRHQQADRLLRRVNHLLRWYRVATGQATIIELTRAQASPFHFTVEGTSATWGGTAPLEYEPASLPLPNKGSRIAFGEAVRQGLGAKSDPDVAGLNLLDAEHALSVGRFREAVLLCWAAIDSTFVRKFKDLVDRQLSNEWSGGREFLKGFDFGLRHKMTTGLRLLAGRSLYAEPDGFWDDLSTSYDLRNRIIHEGQIAHEDDARLAINLVKKVINIVTSLPGQI
jgi:hypothetical protein